MVLSGVDEGCPLWAKAQFFFRGACKLSLGWAEDLSPNLKIALPEVI
jgi:hypothetical protein